MPALRRGKPQFERAADGSMSLMEHLRELRSRLLKASIAVVLGLIAGYFFAESVLYFLTDPYCDLNRAATQCDFNTKSPVDEFLLELRVALYLGLLIAAPFWLYQLWAFIAPGLHRRERRYTYAFVAIATPLFIAGAVLAHFVVAKSLPFFLRGSRFQITLELSGYFDFVTGMMLLFGAGFEFPLVLMMLNFAGLVSARKMLSMWRVAVFVMFLFGAIVTPTPDPFGMSALAGSMCLLYFAAVGVAFLNDRRRARSSPYAGLADDEVSPLEYDEEGNAVPAVGPSQSERLAPVAGPLPLDRRYDDTT
ncbi:MAG TPA: twin-arginine translocase subunit TatC [Micromonosporaceae bacterium]|nr:twin-arginine translocase subunit TatC [Micromonosporaceae bacterium]